MTEQELREKIARIIAKHLCKNRYSHFQLYGDSANCYSRENFAECEAIADTVDALIAAGIGDVSKWKDKATAAELVAQAAANTAIERIEEWKHRAEVWKQATKDMIDTDICFGCHARATGICFKQGPNPGTDECMNAIYKQAEKELQEERKDVR